MATAHDHEHSSGPLGDDTLCRRLGSHLFYVGLVGVGLLDPGGRFLRVNDTLCGYLGAYL